MGIPTRELLDQPTSQNGDDDLSPTDARRVGAVNDIIGYMIEMPLATLAAFEEHGQPEGSVSPYAMDIFAIENTKSLVSRSIVAFANDYPVLAAVLDRLTIGGPLLGLVVASVTLGAQIAENHGKLPGKIQSVIPGLVPRDQMAEVVLARAEELQKQAQVAS